MTTGQTNPAENRVIAEEVYDMIMGEIEPDLILANVPLLAETYKDESTEDHESRMQRYAVAYKKFDIESAKFLAEVGGQARATQRKALQSKEAEDKLQETNILNSLASAFN